MGAKTKVFIILFSVDKLLCFYMLLHFYNNVGICAHRIIRFKTIEKSRSQLLQKANSHLQQ